MRKFLCMLMVVLTILMCAGCGGPKGETLSGDSGPEDEAVKITFNADFYDNAGDLWLSATGSTFNIEPNKVKEYTYSTEGYWEYSWAMSSVMSVYIDGKQIDSCGSTIIFADNRLEILDMNIPEVVNTHARTNDAYIGVDEPWFSMNWTDYWTVQWWCINEQSHGRTLKPRVVVIQSQTGEPIRMYSGSDVSWELCKNLPKTTHITIDGMDLYVHRANFSIIDTSILKG